jgi:hypothetical protein
MDGQRRQERATTVPWVEGDDLLFHHGSLMWNFQRVDHLAVFGIVSQKPSALRNRRRFRFQSCSEFGPLAWQGLGACPYDGDRSAARSPCVVCDLIDSSRQDIP